MPLTALRHLLRALRVKVAVICDRCIRVVLAVQGHLASGVVLASLLATRLATIVCGGRDSVVFIASFTVAVVDQSASPVVSVPRNCPLCLLEEERVVPAELSRVVMKRIVVAQPAVVIF
jgi:hypothetical protein